MQSRGKQQNQKDWRSLKENQKYQGNISCNDRHNKGQKWEAEEIKQRGQKYTELFFKKSFNDPDNHNGVITHLEPYILE